MKEDTFTVSEVFTLLAQNEPGTYKFKGKQSNKVLSRNYQSFTCNGQNVADKNIMSWLGSTELFALVKDQQKPNLLMERLLGEYAYNNSADEALLLRHMFEENNSFIIEQFKKIVKETIGGK